MSEASGEKPAEDSFLASAAAKGKNCSYYTAASRIGASGLWSKKKTKKNKTKKL